MYRFTIACLGCYGFALLVVNNFPAPPNFLFFAFAIFAVIILKCCLVLLGLKKHFYKHVLNLSIISLVFVLWLANYHSLRLSQRLPHSLEGTEVLVVGKVSSLVQSDIRRIKFDFEVSSWLDLEGKHLEGFGAQTVKSPLFPSVLSEWSYRIYEPRLPIKLKLSWYQELEILPGQIWQLKVKLKRARSSFNPDSFDYETWLYANGYGAVGYVRKGQENRLLSEAKVSVNLLRQSLKEQLLGVLDGAPYGGLLVALMIGDRSGISPENQKIMQLTGTSHLLAISGMHIGFVALISYLLSQFVFKSWIWVFSVRKNYFFNKKASKILPSQLASVFALLCAIAYSVLAGSTLPTQRAIIMVATYCLANIFYTPKDFFIGFFVALLLVNVWDPMAVFSLGFYLSFLAVFSIQWVLLFHFSSGPEKRIPLISTLNLMLRSQVAVFFALGPILLLGFGFFNPLSFVANLIAIPLVSWLVLPFLLSSMIVMSFFEGVSVFFLFLTHDVVEYLFLFLTHVARFNLLFVEFKPSLLVSASLLVFIGFFISPLPSRMRILSVVFFLPLVFGTVSSNKNHLKKGEFELTMLDVGQGLAVVIETKAHRLIYDTGPTMGSSLDSGSAIILPYLKARNFNYVDKLVISHGDSDHIGGLNSVLSLIEVKELLLTQKLLENRHDLRLREQNLSICLVGKSWVWDGVEFKVIYPFDNGLKPNIRLSPNNQSCVLRVMSNSMSVLLPGDIEKEVEARLVDKKRLDLDVDVLIAAHHGSNTSSSGGFIDSVTPHLVLFSSGYRSRYGHPHPKVLRRLDLRGLDHYNTADFGAIRLSSALFNRDAPELALGLSRKNYRYFWHFLSE